MLCITHAVVGGAVGSFVSSPFMAFFLGIISHLIVDKVPHFWPEKKKYQDYFMIFDGICSFLIIIYFFSTGNILSPVVWGALGGVSVDLVLVVFARFYKPLLSNAVRVWHEARQVHKNHFAYIFSDVFLIFIFMTYLLLVRS